MDRFWEKSIEKVDFAFQPIVNITTGKVYGYELLLREYDKAGFRSITEFFDTAYNESMLYKVDLALREKAIKKFKNSGKAEGKKLFYNIDNRVLEMPDYFVGNTSGILKKYNIDSSQIVFEISERHQLKAMTGIKNILNIYKQQGYCIAIDDYGTGYSGMHQLYFSEPDIIKIDRFFIADIAKDYRKKLFIRNIINLAHVLGIKIIAEGVETEEELKVCRDIGCDFAQGYYIQRPTLNLNELEDFYRDIHEDHGYHFNEDKLLIKENIEKVETISINSRMDEVFDMFKKNPSRRYFVALNKQDEPLGIIKEESIKSYVYSPFGKELLINETGKHTLKNYISNCGIADIKEKHEKIVEMFSMNSESEGIIITKNGKYLGMLSAHSLLKIINEKRIIAARDQNPLTKLPGNKKIKRYIERAVFNKKKGHVLFYFDFDNFKPFNDVYGFEAGDRAIITFANILEEYFSKEEEFIGHIGGDDFFVGVSIGDKKCEEIIEKAEKVAVEFSKKAAEFYENEDRDRGVIKSEDRFGEIREFGLLKVSFGCLIIDENSKIEDEKELSKKVSELKKEAKKSEKGSAVEKI